MEWLKQQLRAAQRTVLGWLGLPPPSEHPTPRWEVPGNAPPVPQARAEAAPLADPAAAVRDITTLPDTADLLTVFGESGWLGTDPHQRDAALGALRELDRLQAALHPTTGQPAGQPAGQPTGQPVTTAAEVPARMQAHLRGTLAQARQELEALTDAPATTVDWSRWADTRRTAERRVAALEGNLAYYTTADGAAYLQQLAERHPDIVLSPQPLPLGEIIARSGLLTDAAGERLETQIAADVTNDLLARQFADALWRLHRRAGEPDTLATYAADPAQYATQIQGTLHDLHRASQPFSQLPESRPEFPELDAIQALHALAIAETHALTHATLHGALPEGIPPHAALETLGHRLRGYAAAALSLSAHFLEHGPAAADPRMVRVREQLHATLEHSTLPTLPVQQAYALATTLAETSAHLHADVTADACCPAPEAVQALDALHATITRAATSAPTHTAEPAPLRRHSTIQLHSLLLPSTPTPDTRLHHAAHTAEAVLERA